ncbi:MAG: DUF4143 domain-containing protein [Deltaproteobacteria bacterium]|nr:DUF4143 domain-containing protein [Deltaproteobacteria bacterium]
MLRHACQPDDDPRPAYPPALLHIRRASLRRSYCVAVVCLAGADPTGGDDEPAALVLVSHPDGDVGTFTAVIRELSGLTPTEGHAATMLLQGTGVEVIATRSAMSLNTVRTHLERTFSRVEVGSQCDLVRMLLAGRRGSSCAPSRPIETPACRRRYRRIICGLMQYPRFLEKPLRSRTSRGKARLVLGARQTGKSTIFERLRGASDLLIDLQERGERARLARDPAAFTRALLPARRHRHVFVDEVQRVPELLDEIQHLLDRHPGKFTFTLTGSSVRRLRRRDANLLPGRTHRFHLAPVCAWEIVGRDDTVVAAAPTALGAERFPERALSDHLVLGSMPAAFIEGKRYRATLQTYAEAYLEEEVLREMAARNLGAYSRFLELAAVESGKPINLTKISQESDLALSTLRGFYGVLEDTLLGFTVRPFGGSPRARLLKTPRFFFFDVGVRNAVARLPLDDGILATQAGQLFEHWVACELMARIGYLGPGWRLGYWRTVDGAEIDFILETPRETIPIEVKYTANPRPADAREVERFVQRHPKQSRRGLLVCRVRRPEQLTEHVRAIPWDTL